MHQPTRTGPLLAICLALASVVSVASPSAAGQGQASLSQEALSQGTPPTVFIGGFERRIMEASRIPDAEAFVLDGRLDEAFWSRAIPARDFIQIDPLNGEPATEPTEVRIAFSRDTFYMGVTASTPNRTSGSGSSAGATSSCRRTIGSCGASIRFSTSGRGISSR